MTWIVRRDDPLAYVTEVDKFELYFHPKQKRAKRFKNQGRAYRVAMKEHGLVVVRLKSRTIGN